MRYKLSFLLLLGVFLIPVRFSYADCDITVETSLTAQAGFGHNSTHKRGQSFTPSCSGTISSIDYASGYFGTPSDGLEIGISQTRGNSDLGLSATVPYTSFQDQALGCISNSFTFSSPVSVTSGQTYYYTVQRTGSYSGSNWFYWCGTGSNTYGGGDGQYSDGSDVWSTDTGDDYNSKIYIAESGGGGGGATSTATTTSSGCNLAVADVASSTCVTYMDWLYMNLWILFCVSFLPIGFFFSLWKQGNYYSKEMRM